MRLIETLGHGLATHGVPIWAGELPPSLRGFVRCYPYSDADLVEYPMANLPVTRSRVLVNALRAGYPAVPQAILEFDRIAGCGEPEPNSLEWSARVLDASDGARLTYYFDVARGGAAVGRIATARFVSLGAALGARVPRAFGEALGKSVSDRAVLQLVLGVDASRDSGSRAKLYVILRAAASQLVDSLIAAAGAERPSALDAGKVYILGFDFGSTGLLDAKLYYRLDPARVARVVAQLDADLMAGTREVVLQRCIHRERTRMYFHAQSPTVLPRHLAKRARDDDGFAELLRRHAMVERRLAAHGRLEPWIVAFGLEDHRLRLDASTVYFHFVPADST